MHVAVVGAGIIGLTAAVRLRAAGHAVTLIAPELDAAGRPHAVAGATHAAAGMLAPLAETQFSQDDLAPLLQAGWEAYPALVDLLAAFTDVETGFLAQGAWIVAADPSDARAWDHVLEHASILGRRVEPVSVRALRRAEPALAPGLAAGFDAPDDHQVDPRRLAAACVAALRAETGPDGGPLPVASRWPTGASSPPTARSSPRAWATAGSAARPPPSRSRCAPSTATCCVCGCAPSSCCRGSRT